jgi:hypothetical protein
MVVRGVPANAADHPAAHQPTNHRPRLCAASTAGPAALMRSADAVLTAKTSQTLQDLIPLLNKVSGLPVVDANNRVIGVISRKVCAGCVCVCVGGWVGGAALPACCVAQQQSWLRARPGTCACADTSLSFNSPALRHAAGHHPRAPC